MNKEIEGIEGYRGYHLFETLPSGVHIVRRKWGLAVPVVSNDDSELFESKLIPEFGFEKVKSFDEVIKLVKIDEYEGVPYRTFMTAPYPFTSVLDRMNGDRERITLSVEYPLEDQFSSALGFCTLDDIFLGFRMKRDYWKILDEQKRKLNPIYKKMKNAWRRSFESK